MALCANILSSESQELTREYLIKNFHFDMYGSNKNYGYFKLSYRDTGPYVIRECHCVENMSRTHRRFLVEEPLVEKVQQVFNKNRSLIIYSIGSGACYQELSICVHLAKEGYSIQKFVLVDSDYTSMEKDERVSAFRKLFHLLFSENARISVFQNEKDYFNAISNSKEEKPDVILCIDMERSNLSWRRNNYRQMLGEQNNKCILAYHNIDQRHDHIVHTEIVEVQGVQFQGTDH